MAENDARAGAQMNDQVRRMPLYRVLLHDDGLHLARYVAQVLQEVFYFSRRAAEEITSEAICSGMALCAIETLEQANGHAEKLTSAKLTATIEPEA
ncbi:MAG: ATP-dependent Clp protease adaptor ClpS [Candidatus Brocadiia bacterium]